MKRALIAALGLILSACDGGGGGIGESSAIDFDGLTFVLCQAVD